jgi:protein N-lysine methyltransferase METTL21A
VGLVVWQSAFLLAELLVRAPPFGAWGDVRVVDLGTGTGEAPPAFLLTTSFASGF